MRTFKQIEAMAAGHHGGAKGLAEKLKTDWGGKASDLKRSDDRFLSGITHAVFSSGFAWKVIEAKWPGFEEAFDGFNPKRVASYSDEKFDELLKDRRIVRNGAKIRSTIANARFVLDIAEEHGSFGAFLRNWPTTDQAGLMEVFKKRASRLGGNTAPYFLRFNGWDAYILSRDVTTALIREGVVDKTPTSKRDMAAVQAAFNAWTKQSGRPQREVSRILAMSVGQL
jgi:3-methyladenine DNA glycosylase Tag